MFRGVRGRLCSGRGWFEAGQAAFTLLVAVLFNLLVLVGWRVGVVQVFEDVAPEGCLVSVVIGALLWPRGVASGWSRTTWPTRSARAAPTCPSR